jgi:hypothetical protein
LWGYALTGEDRALQTAAFFAGVGAYGLGAPLVHLGHGSGRKAAASLGLRFGLPVGGAIVGALLGQVPGIRRSWDAGDGLTFNMSELLAVYGFLGGVVAAIVVDDSTVARERRKPAVVSSLQPFFVPGAGGGSFALAGRF